MSTIHNPNKTAATKIGGPHSKFGFGRSGHNHPAERARDSLASEFQQSSAPLSVLLVDHQPADLQRHWRMLAEQFGLGARTFVAHTAAEGLSTLARESIEVVVAEYVLPDADGLGLLASITAHYPHVSTIMLTGHGSEQVAAKAMQLGARDYLIKNQLDAATLARSIRRATRLTESDRQEAQRVEQLHQSRLDLDEVVRALSHDMTANFMLLDHSFRRLKDSTVAEQSPVTPELSGRAPGNVLGAMTQQFAHVEACLRESKRFLDELVMLARTGGVQMDASRAELAPIVQEVLFEQRELLAERGIQVTMSPDLPAVWCNPARVKQVLTNLIRNAAKHGCSATEPRIDVVYRSSEAAAAAQHDGEHDTAVWLAVCDNGQGIPAEFHDAIFLPGRRLRGAHPDGSGMGLSIVKRIVEYYGGQVHVDSTYANGTAIVFSLPSLPGA